MPSPLTLERFAPFATGLQLPLHRLTLTADWWCLELEQSQAESESAQECSYGP